MPKLQHVPKNQLLRRGFLKGCGACLLLVGCTTEKESGGFPLSSNNPTNTDSNQDQPSSEPSNEPEDSASPPTDTSQPNDTDDSGQTPPENAYEVYLGNFADLLQVGGVEFFTNNGVMIAITRIGTGTSDFSVVSSICTHQGCTIQEDADATQPNQGDNWFHCPCHDARFDALGAVLSGPAPTDLQSYDFVVIDNTLYVTGV